MAPAADVRAHKGLLQGLRHLPGHVRLARRLDNTRGAANHAGTHALQLCPALKRHVQGLTKSIRRIIQCLRCLAHMHSGSLLQTWQGHLFRHLSKDALRIIQQVLAPLPPLARGLRHLAFQRRHVVAGAPHLNAHRRQCCCSWSLPRTTPPASSLWCSSRACCSGPRARLSLCSHVCAMDEPFP